MFAVSTDAPGKAEQWSSVISFLNAAGIADRSFGDFAHTVKIDWPANRLHEPLGPFLELDWDATQKRRGFGAKKLDQLFLNMSAIAGHLGWAYRSEPRLPVTPPSADFDPATMEKIGLPQEFPVSTGFFSERVLEFCANANLKTVADLARLTSSTGWKTLSLAYKNFGSRSAGEVERFSAALRRIDKVSLQEFLPIRASGLGLDLGLAAMHVANSHRTIGFEGLSKRLVFGQTLEEVAIEFNVSRERVRQVESILLDAIQQILAAVPAARTELWRQWAELGAIRSVKTEQGEGADQLASAAVHRLFIESETGKSLLAEREKKCVAMFRLISEEPLFYSGKLNLAEFVASRADAIEVHHLLAWNERSSAFVLEEGAGTIEAVNPRAKQVVASLLRRGVTSATEILDFISKVQRLDPWDLPSFKRNYLYWRQDSDFPAIDVVFPRRVEQESFGLKSRPTFVRLRRAVHQSEFAAPNRLSFLGAGIEQLQGIDQRLRSILAATADSQPLLGLLPVGSELQTEAIEAIKSVVGISFDRLLLCLRELPCITGYVLAIGPGSKMDGLAFFEPLEDYLGFPIPAIKRSVLSDAFRQAGQELGLLPIPAKERTDNVWPFVFQAAIIPRFVEPLIQAILRELRDAIPPDLESVPDLALFARKVAHHINPGQQRLRKVLQSDAGVSVGRNLLRAYQTGDFAQMPPHLEQRCSEAFRDFGIHRRDSLVSPFVAFDHTNGEMSLVLPRQPQKLLRPDTLWRLDAAHRFAADAETRVPVRELDQTNIGFELSPIQHGSVRKWEPQVELRLSEDSPIWLFDVASGRRVQFRADTDDGVEVYRLPSGRDFAVVALRQVESDLPRELWVPVEENLQAVIYESFWGQTAIALSHGDHRWRISAVARCNIVFPTAPKPRRAMCRSDVLLARGGTREEINTTDR